MKSIHEMMKEIDVASISLVASNQNPLWNKYSSRADSWSSAKGRTLPIDPESSIRSYFPAIDSSALLATLLPPIQRWNIDEFCATITRRINLWHLDIFQGRKRESRRFRLGYDWLFNISNILNIRVSLNS